MIRAVYVQLSPSVFIGLTQEMSFEMDKTVSLWQIFKPRVKEIKNRLGTEFFSISCYPDDFLRSFNPKAMFQKWAAVEVGSATHNVDGLQELQLEGGLYAVFVYQGRVDDFSIFAKEIFSKVLPEQGYVADSRPHFTRFGPGFNMDDSHAVETFWVSVRAIH